MSYSNFIQDAKEYVKEDLKAGIGKLVQSGHKGVSWNKIHFVPDGPNKLNADIEVTIDGSTVNVSVVYWRDEKDGDVYAILKNHLGEDSGFGTDEFDRFIDQSYHHLQSVSGTTKIVAAGEEDENEEDMYQEIDDEPTKDGLSINDGDGLQDRLDDVSDTLEDLQDSVDEVEQDDVSIELNNNITDHYIAECDGCHGVFISAVVKSDVPVDHVFGTCPLCDKETNQYLNWLIVKSTEANV